MKAPLCVVGDGAWGTAVAMLLADNGHAVRLLCREQSVVDTITSQRRNLRYFPHHELSSSIHATCDPRVAFADTSLVFEAVPVAYLRATLVPLRPLYRPEQTWVVLSKGIELDTLLLPAQLLQDLFGTDMRVAVLAGPSFAQDLAERQPTAVSLAATDAAIGALVQMAVNNAYFCAVPTEDVIGVQVCAALKNVLAFGMGLCEGAGYTDNPKAFFFVRMTAELQQVLRAWGGCPETLLTYAGLGDMVLTALGKHSRNLLVGRARAQGEPLDTFLQRTGTHPEVLNTLRSLMQARQKFSLELPLTTALYAILFDEKPVSLLMDTLIR